MKPFDPSVLRTVPESRIPFAALGMIGMALGFATVAATFALTGVVVATARGQSVTTPLAWLVGLFAVRAVLAAASEYLAAWAGIRVTSALRRRLLSVWSSAPADARPAPATALTLATAGCGSVEPYVARYLPALVTAAVVPAVAVVTLAVVDWASALVVVATLPLLPVFAALIGRSTQQETDKRWRALADLAGHFLDVVRGLPTLVNYGRAGRQVEAIAEVSGRHRSATMRTLRLAFLSSAALEMLATISVAIVAVLCGLRLTWGSMSLGTALVAILLAPEAYWPIRRVGQEFHNAADGASALADIAAALEESTLSQAGGAGARVAVPTVSYEVAARGLTYRYPRSALDVLSDLTFVAGPGLTVVTGESGVGKTTLLELVAGMRTPSAGNVSSAPAHVVTQVPFLPTGTVAAALRLGNDAGIDAMWEVLRAVGLDGFVAGLPHGIETAIGDDGFGLSAGQRARLGVARALLAPETVILLDEPTAHLDEAGVETVQAAITELASRRCVLAVTHRPELLALADHHLHLTPAAVTA